MTDLTYELIPIIALVCVSILLFAFALLISIRSRKSRVGADSSDFFDKLIEKKKLSLSRSASKLSWKAYVALLISIPVTLGTITYILLPIKSMCLLFAALGLFVPELIIRHSSQKRKKLYDEQFARALRSLASSLRAGRSIEQAINEVGQNPFVDEQIRKGFRQIASDLAVGVPLDEAFYKFAKQTDSTDAKDVAAAISMQSKVGGSEARVISSIVQNINERLIVRKEIKSMFSETNVLVLVMDIMPWAVFIILFFTSYQLISVFFESIVMTLLLVGLMVFTTVGSFFIRKMIKNAKGG